MVSHKTKRLTNVELNILGLAKRQVDYNNNGPPLFQRKTIKILIYDLLCKPSDEQYLYELFRGAANSA